MARVTTMGELAATIAHDINQPLAAVVTNANACIRWLNAPIPDLDEVRAAANRISGEGKRASEVLSRIRTLMKKRPVSSEAVHLNDVVLEVLDLVRPKINRHCISLRLNLAPSLPAIRGDAIQLQQVLLNLLVNAIEASAETQEQSPEIVLSTEELPDSALVAIRDSGTGIEPDRLDEIFKPFYTTKDAGMGMGLSISRSILEAHAGKLWATRNEGPGATFRLSIQVSANV
jgi:signal transduction histidine kinase